MSYSHGQRDLKALSKNPDGDREALQSRARRSLRTANELVVSSQNAPQKLYERLATDTTQFVCRSQKNAGRDFEALLDRHLDFLTQRFKSPLSVRNTTLPLCTYVRTSPELQRVNTAVSGRPS